MCHVYSGYAHDYKLKFRCIVGMFVFINKFVFELVNGCLNPLRLSSRLSKWPPVKIKTEMIKNEKCVIHIIEVLFINTIHCLTNTIPHNTIQYNTIQYNTIQYNTIQYNTIQYNTIQYNTIQYNTIQYNTIQYNTIQYNTIQYNTIQYNTIQYNTIGLHVQ